MCAFTSAFAGTTWERARVRDLAARFRPSDANSLPPSKIEGAGNAGCALHPRSRVPNCAKKAHTSIQVQRRQSDIPCAMALRLTSCSPRWSGLVVTVTLEKPAFQGLSASIAAPGPHDFAVRLGVFVRRDHSRLTPKRPSRPAPHVS